MTDYYRKIRAKRRALFWEPEAACVKAKRKEKASHGKPVDPIYTDSCADESAEKYAEKSAKNFSVKSADKSAEKTDKCCQRAGSSRAEEAPRADKSSALWEREASDRRAEAAEKASSAKSDGAEDGRGNAAASGMMEASEEIGVLDSFVLYTSPEMSGTVGDTGDFEAAGNSEAVIDAADLAAGAEDAIDEDAFDFRRQYSDEAYRNFFERFETNSRKRYAYRFVKRSFDIVISFTALILLSPLFVVVAVAVKVDSKGPVFFTHLRMGRGGKPFKCYKFRSMRVEAPRDRAKGEFSDRELYLTRVGRLLRRLSIDELPQLFCCLVGTMSLIGPRPVVLTETALIEDRRALGAYSLRPGLSGYAQVRCRDEVEGKNKAILDAIYVKNACPWLDWKLMVLTLGCVITRRGNSSEPVRRRQSAGL